MKQDAIEKLEKLNKLFNCNDFSVFKLITGEKLTNELKD
jgi:succinate dehydrogenase flavin-adding protein (antitoxin of CptAB toxin-antitoxin module)